LETVVYFKNGEVKVYGELYSSKRSSSCTCPKIPRKESIINKVKVPLKYVIMRPPRHQQRYEAAWVLLKDKGVMESVCLTSFEDTMRFYICDGVHRCHVAYDAGYDCVPAFIMLEKQEPEWLKGRLTFDGQPRNLFERMQLPEKVVPESCQHRLKWQVMKNHADIPFVCNWCEYLSVCYKKLVGTEITECDFPDS
jgi:hypothetical protein